MLAQSPFETMAPPTFSGALTAASDYVENNKKTVAIAAGATSAALVRHPSTDFAPAPTLCLRASFPAGCSLCLEARCNLRSPEGKVPEGNAARRGV